MFLIVSIFPHILVKPKLFSIYRDKGQLGFDITIRSNQLPISAGLGSSSAFSVAVTTILLQYFYYNYYETICPTCKIGDLINSNANDSNDIVPCEHFQNIINEFAFQSECIFHGNNLSGIDNYISTYGGAYAYSKIRQKMYKNFPKLQLLIINTNIDHCTLDMVNKVKNTLTCEILKEMDELMNKCIEEIECLIENPKQIEILELLNENIEKNQKYLEKLGISNSRINKACEILKEYGLNGKITGAGGGGCIYCIIKDEEEKSKSKIICNDFKREKMNCFLAEVGGCGVLLHKDLNIPPSPCSLL